MTADELSAILDELGERLGPAGERVFALAVQWQLTAGIVGLLASGIAITAIIIGYRWLWRVSEHADSMDTGMLRVMGAFASLLGLAYLGTAFVDSTLRLLNIEYAAIRDLLGSIK